MMQRSFLARRLLGPARSFSTAAGIQARFEEAYQARAATLKNKVTVK